MPINTQLSGSPYHNRYDPLSDYYRVLFKGSYAVQIGELNELQDIFQNQVERFADNIFSVGTIVSGCNFQFYKNYGYIKLPDTQTTGEAVDPGSYVGKFVKDDYTGLRGYVVNHQDGYELDSPDLKTIYVKLIDSGDDETQTTFSPGNNVTISDSNNPIDDVTVTAGGSGFSNTDSVVILPALVVNVTSGSFSVSDYLVNPSTQANVEIVDVDTTSVDGKTVLLIQPRSTDLTNTSANSAMWAFSLYDAVTTPGGSGTATIEQINGQDAQARVRTNAVGAATEISMLNKGKGYTRGATATIKTSNTSASVGTLDLDPRNFVAKCRIPSDANSVGTGYAFGVTDGQIYQQGHLLRVESQTVIVSKYSNAPNNVVVGFRTDEDIIDATEDNTLYDNATGEPNELAPGADRLKLVPSLVVLTKEQVAANNGFFGLVEWNDGKPAIQNQDTRYSALGSAIATNIYESSGNFVMDAFQVTTESPANVELSSTKYTAVIDPGQGYINGRKVQVMSNYKIDMHQGLDTTTSNNSVSLAYGNYVRVNGLVGQFDFAAGAQVSLYNQPSNHLSNNTVIEGGTITPYGEDIGSARVRSIEIESGLPGTISAVYQVYLFDIQMNAGKNFRNVKSIFYDGGTYDGIADLILTYDATTSANVAQVWNTEENELLFHAGVESLKDSTNSTYTFRTSDTVNLATATATWTITQSNPNEFYPWSGDLSATEMASVLVVPVEAAIRTSNHSGTVTANTSTTTLEGTTTDFDSDYDAGDYIEITDDSANVVVRRVEGIINSTAIILDSAPDFDDTVNHRRIFPQNLPIPFGQRPGLYANVDGTGQVLALELRDSNTTVMTIDFANSTLETQISFDLERQDVSAATKTARRNRYIKIAVANSGGQADGPWCLGVPDAFRLRGVYVSSNSTISEDSSDVTQHFYIDHNQNPNYMGLSQLNLRPKAPFTLTATDYLLVCFDYFERDNQGYFDTSSYLRTANDATIAAVDALGFANLSAQTASSSWEIPEVFSAKGKYYDLRKYFDFRPTAANTVDPTSASSVAPINPSNTVTLAAHSKYPKPNASMKTRVDQYLGRIDDIYIGSKGQLYILKGIPDVNPRNRYQSNHPKDSLRLQTLVIPPYPNAPRSTTADQSAKFNTNISNGVYSGKRIKKHSIVPWLNTTNLQTSQPMVYTMEDIATIERRVADLEYYQALALLETNVTNRIIPSSIDPALSRFKFGFFADSFETTLYSDQENPQYNASIEVEGDLLSGVLNSPMDGLDSVKSPNESEDVAGTISAPALKYTYRLVPPKRVWSLKHFTENVYYFDQEIIKQETATQKPEPCVITIANVSIGNTSTSTTGGDTTQYSYYLQVNRAQSTVWINSATGLANIYFDIRAGATKGFGGLIDVLDETGQTVASTRWAQNGQKQLGPNDRFFLETNPVAQDFDQALSKQEYRSFERLQGALQDYATGSAKLPLKVPLGGGRFLIRTEVSDTTVLNDPSWKMLVEFPGLYTEPTNETDTDGNDINYTIISDPDCSPLPPDYTGSLESGSLTMQTWACSNLFRTMAAGYKAFVLIGTGLKPNTVHKLFLDTVEWPYTVPMYNAAGTGSYNERADAIVYGSDLIAADVSSQSINGIFTFGVDVDYVWSDLTELGAWTFWNNDLFDTKVRTNRKGQFVCLVFFPLEVAGWFSQDFNAPSYNFDLIYQSEWNNATQSDIQEKLLQPTYGSSGYTTLVVQDNTGASQAVRVFANRTPNKTIPFDPRGFI